MAAQPLAIETEADEAADGPASAAEPRSEETWRDGARAASSGDSAVPSAAPAPPPPPPRRGKLGATVRPLLLLIAAPLVFVLALPVLMLGQEITAPSWITSRVEAQAAEMLGGGAIDVGEITLTVGRDLHPVIRLRHGRLIDAAGTELVRLPEAEIQLSPRGLILRREVLPQEIRLVGGALALRRQGDGRLAMSFEGAGEGPAVGTEGAPGAVAVSPDALAALFERPALEAIEAISAEGLIVNYLDERAGRAWTLDAGRVRLDRRGGLAVAASASLITGRSYVTDVALSLDRPGGAGAAQVALTVSRAASRDIATQSPALAWLAVLDAPLSVSSRAEIAGDGTLGEVSATLEIGAGTLRPSGGAQPLGFEEAKAYLRFDAAEGRVEFDEVQVASDWGSLAASGRATFGDLSGGLPKSLVGQFAFSNISIEPPGVYQSPLRLPSAEADFRLRLDPFRVEVGQVLLTGERGTQVIADGEVTAGQDGWAVAAQARIPRLGVRRAVELWPPGLLPGTRDWFDRNLTAGVLTDVAAVLRLRSGAAPLIWVSSDFEGATARLVPTLPPVEAGAGRLTFQDRRIAVALDRGRIEAPQGGTVDAAGTTFVLEDAGAHPLMARVELRTESTITAALSLLDLPPFGYPSGGGLATDVAEGRARVEGRLDFPLGDDRPPERVDWDIAASLSGVSSAGLLPGGRQLAAQALTMEVDRGRLSVGGRMRIGAVPVQATWSRALGEGSAGTARIEGEVTLSPEFLDEFGIALPDGMVRGEGQGRVSLTFPASGPPSFALSSDLRGVGLSIPEIGWSKAPAAVGSLEVAGTLGDTPRVDRLVLSAPGLDAAGSVTLREDGAGLDRLALSRLRVGGWLDAPVTLVGRGGAAPGVVLDGGSLDLRDAAFGGGGGGEVGPLTVTLDRLQVTEGIALTAFRGEFGGAGGLSGTFTGRINGGTAVQGTLVPENGRFAVRVRSADAGGAIRDAGFLPNATGGSLDLVLRPVGGEGTFDGTAVIRQVRVREAPELAQLLDAISVVGLLQQLDGQGLAFDSVDAEFRIAPDRVTIARAAAVGPGLGISVDGYYMPGPGTLDLQGVVSPFYFINAIGSVLTRPGEGLVGFNFTLRGPVGSPEVGVNPLSLLTPGMFREIFRRAPPELGR
ncbi:uncharacterized protein Wenmar_01553 [Wenxinia marina DSM 24838]|uniref:Uncharacterized protein n=1 Tax=Wenxinia marina DSM 24838 TaxID=1123501 RepID=A0A0D0QG17_9RHOB|nr:uncharacterized protein Wenmar_01553 [Wenxinia marina DSM 24838]